MKTTTELIEALRDIAEITHDEDGITMLDAALRLEELQAKCNKLIYELEQDLWKGFHVGGVRKWREFIEAKEACK